jgi:hypothetical protein
VGSLLVLAGCANGSGLRVEDSNVPAPASTPSVPTNRGFAPSEKPTPMMVPNVTLSLEKVRDTLLADKKLDEQSRKVLDKCTVIARCLKRGPTVDAMHTGRPQLVVLIHTLDNFVFGAFLIAPEPSPPRRVWSIEAQQLKINAGRQGELIVQSDIFDLDDKPCCPSGTRVEVYRWVGGQMTKVSSQDQKGD